MKNESDFQKKVTELTCSARALLDELASQDLSATRQQVKDLEFYASELAKLAYGYNRPESIVEEIRYLISWCDHIHDPEIRDQFFTSLRNRPLVAPSWSNS